MPKWEYAVKEFKADLDEENLKKNCLDPMGEDGWELILVMATTRVGWMRFIFRRIRAA